MSAASAQTVNQSPESTVQRLVPLAEVRPFVTEAPRIAGGQPVRRLKTVYTSDRTQVLADRVLVQLAKGTTPEDEVRIHQDAAAAGAGIAKPVLRFMEGFEMIDVSGAASVEAAVAAYRATRGVLSAGPSNIGKFTVTPNDPGLNFQAPHLNRIAAMQAWDRTELATGSLSGAVKIAVLDTGIGPHPDLDAKIVDQTNTMTGGSAADDFGHGTHMAGLAGASPNNGIGIAGVGYYARLLNAKISTVEDFDASSVVDAIAWATDHGANVISMSFNTEPGDCESSFTTGAALVRQALSYAWTHNVVLVASAGNDGTTNKRLPASCPHVISVAYTNNDDFMSPDSTHGTWVSVAAPGSGVYSAIPEALPTPGGCTRLSNGAAYAFCSGTSPAAAIVSGIAALVRSTGMTSNQAIFDRITTTADPVSGTGDFWQFGRVNAFSAVRLNEPTGLTRVGGVPDGITLRWFDNSLNESGFQLWYQEVGTSVWHADTTVPANSGPVGTVTRTGLGNGTLYDFKMKAFDNGGGVSDFSPFIRAFSGANLLTVRKVGGIGVVTSSPAGINCPIDMNQCAATFDANVSVTLSAIGRRDGRRVYNFDHWEGACSGISPCTLAMHQERDVKAVFKLENPN